MIVFNDLCINGRKSPLGTINECKFLKKDGGNHLAFILSKNEYLELDIQLSVAEFNYSEWVQAALILDFKLSIAVVPPWMKPYSNALPGCVEKIAVTMKTECSRSDYLSFTDNLETVLSETLCRRLGKAEATALWELRCVPIPIRPVKSIKFLIPNFGRFSLLDVERLKNDDKWLSDSHVTLALRDCFQEFVGGNSWAGLKITLLDTAFWSNLSQRPEDYSEKYRNRVNLLEYDLAVMPMYESNHWRLGIVEKPAMFLQGNCTFYILDSLSSTSHGISESKQLQAILLKYFSGEKYSYSRLTTKVPQVPAQLNTKDCACFTIYFGKKFIQNPQATLALIKTPPPNASEGLSAWGLKSNDVTFVRRELRTLLFKYLSTGKADVEYY